MTFTRAHLFLSTRFASHRKSTMLVPINDKQNTQMSTLAFSSGTYNTPKYRNFPEYSVIYQYSCRQ